MCYLKKQCLETFFLSMVKDLNLFVVPNLDFHFNHIISFGTLENHDNYLFRSLSLSLSLIIYLILM